MRNSDNTRLVLYTLQNCIYCNDLKGKLNTLGLDYEEILIDNGFNSINGDALEKTFQTETYPILTIINNKTRKFILSFISKTNLEKQDGIYIFETNEQIINKLKEFYAL